MVPMLTCDAEKLYKVRQSRATGKVFVVFAQQVMEADQGIDTIINTLSKYQLRLQMTISGEEVQLGDFRIRIGRVNSGTQLKLATLVDVGDDFDTADV